MEQLATKDCAILHNISNQCVQTVNYIRKNALQTRLFTLICAEMRSAHNQVMLYFHMMAFKRKSSETIIRTSSGN